MSEKFCPACGVSLPKTLMKCPACGHQFRLGDRGTTSANRSSSDWDSQQKTIGVVLLALLIVGFIGCVAFGSKKSSSDASSSAPTTEADPAAGMSAGELYASLEAGGGIDPTPQQVSQATTKLDQLDQICADVPSSESAANLATAAKEQVDKLSSRSLTYFETLDQVLAASQDAGSYAGGCHDAVAAWVTIYTSENP